MRRHKVPVTCRYSTASLPAMPTIAFVTCAKYPDLHPSDDQLRAELTRRGWTLQPAVWTDPDFDWTTPNAILIRSPWDYYEQPDAFRQWLERMEAQQVRLWNPAALVRWNLNKTYLRALNHTAGIPILPTHWFATTDDPATLPAVLQQLGWDEVVLKPAVSAGAYRTYRFSASDAAAMVPALAEILHGSEALVQPFAPEIVRVGEYSLFFFGGRFSHAVLKSPKAGDYRVQPQYDSHVQGIVPTPDHLWQAQAVVDAIPHPWLYARVDGILRTQPDGSQQHLLMELEVIEPHLFLDFADGAVHQFVDALAAVL